ncbi:hypothetical protein AB0O32_37005 [Streptomyces rubiginosohelvolus]
MSSPSRLRNWSSNGTSACVIISTNGR